MGITVCYEVMLLFTGSVKDSNGWCLVVLSHCGIGTVTVNTGRPWLIFMALGQRRDNTWISGQMSPIPHSLTDFESRTTQLQRSRSGALVTL